LRSFTIAIFFGEILEAVLHIYYIINSRINSQMGIQDVLQPMETVKFRTRTRLSCSKKFYSVFVTSNRIILYANKGRILKSRDIISERLESIHGVEYREKGFVFKKSKIIIQGGISLEINGFTDEIRPLFEFMQNVISNAPRNDRQVSKTI